ncbi:MAG TPA: asparagine synthase (glutamine-hydrolyzing) [Thermoanaerobaculia bacterium]|nr:asparagine synthase (glutamine-hydrolyzing) [Thermoanaerobaculia bacterium]
MCGISVVIDTEARPESVARLLRMHAAIPHRGPDGEGGVLIDTTLRAVRLRSPHEAGGRGIVAGAAFRRLKVIDLSDAASQPFASADERVWICFNGEIYNFRELRERLRSHGHVFRTASDTEVVLAAYDQWGEEAFEKLDGMWAIVILDLRARRAVVSRDRFGIKPLFRFRDGSALLIASEAKQIVAAMQTRFAANAPLVRRYLLGRRIPVLNETFFRGIDPVPEGSVTTIPLGEGSGSSRRFWELRNLPGPAKANGHDPAKRDELEAVLRAAIRSHSVADVPTGMLLSGGLDSSTLAGIMASDRRAAGDTPLPTFSFGFRDRAPEFCELAYVDDVVRRHRLDNFETTFDPAWVTENAGRVMYATEEPVLALPALAQYRVFQLCRERGMTVVLDGEGADEIIGGYPYHQRDLLIDRIARGRIGAFSAELSAMARREDLSRARILREFFVAPLVRRTRKAHRWLDRGYGGRGGPEIEDLRFARTDDGGRDSRVDRRLYRDIVWGNVRIVLGYTDRNAMAHSIEARVPYFDLALVTLMFSLPDVDKVGNGERKRILRDVARRYVPPSVTERRDRMGFGTPDRLILHGMRRDVLERTADDAFCRSGVFGRDELREFIEGYFEGRHDDARAVWRVYALARWKEEFDVSFD